MNLDNLWAKVFREKDKPKQEIPPTSSKSPREKYRSSPQESVLELRGFERTGKMLGGNIGNAQFVKIVDDGGAFSSPILNVIQTRKDFFFQEKERLIW